MPRAQLQLGGSWGDPYLGVFPRLDVVEGFVDRFRCVENWFRRVVSLRDSIGKEEKGELPVLVLIASAVLDDRSEVFFSVAEDVRARSRVLRLKREES